MFRIPRHRYRVEGSELVLPLPGTLVGGAIRLLSVEFSVCGVVIGPEPRSGVPAGAGVIGSAVGFGIGVMVASGVGVGSAIGGGPGMDGVEGFGSQAANKAAAPQSGMRWRSFMVKRF
jgi:hypothetical protein